jgi:hypothetical protein
MLCDDGDLRACALPDRRRACRECLLAIVFMSRVVRSCLLGQMRMASDWISISILSFNFALIVMTLPRCESAGYAIRYEQGCKLYIFYVTGSIRRVDKIN